MTRIDQKTIKNYETKFTILRLDDDVRSSIQEETKK